MKKIMKRLLTGVLTLATVFTALPVTQVHAADSVYTTTDGKAGTIVKIDNGGSEVSSYVVLTRSHQNRKPGRRMTTF